MKTDYQNQVLSPASVAYAYHERSNTSEDRSVDFIFREVNPAFEKLTGLTSQQVTGKKISQVFPASLSRDFDWIAFYRKIHEEGKVQQTEQYFQALGRWFWIHAFSPTRDRFVTFLTDITGLKKEKDGSRENGQLLRRIVRNFPNALICVVTKDFTIEYIAGQRLDDENAVTGPVGPRKIKDIFPQQAGLLKKYGKKSFSGSECSFELSIDSRFYQYHTVPLPQKNGRITSIMLVEEDITAKKRTEDILKAERDMSLQLNQVSSVNEALRICLDYALRLSGMDSGAVYMVNARGGLELKADMGLSAKFIPTVSRYTPDSPQARLVQEGIPRYFYESQLQNNSEYRELTKEGLKVLAIVPVIFRDKSIACLNTSSHSRSTLSDHEQMALESLSSRIGSTITRVQGEEALRQAGERYRILLESSIAGICIQDLDDKIIYANQQFAVMLGYQTGQLAGMDMSRLCSREALVDYRKKTNKRKSGESEIYESQLVRKDGRLIDVLVNATPYRDHKRDIIGSAGIILDITSRKTAEKDLRKNEIRYRKLFESSKDAIMTLEPPAWKFTSGNPAIIEMFQVKDEQEFISLTPWKLSPRRQPDGELSTSKAKRMIRTAMEKGSNFFEWAHRRISGEVFPATVLLTRVGLTEKTFLQATVRDITRQKNIEKALRESEELYRNLYETSLAALWRTRRSDGKFLKANRTTARLMGFKSVEELIRRGKSADLYQNPQDRKRLLRALEEKGEVHEFECPFIMPNGQKRHLLISARDYPDKGFLEGVIKDITEQRILEKERQKLEEQYQQSQKMESIGRLAGGVAHDLNNLLSPIIGYCDLLLGNSSIGKEKQTGYLRQVRKAGLRARDLVRQLLAFGRKQNLEFKAVNLNTVIRNFERLLSRTIRQNIRIRLGLSARIPRIWADIGQIEQVIMNLAVNAQDAMPQGGSLVLTTSRIRVDEQYAQLHQEMIPGDYVLLSITDTGCGMKTEYLEKIFEPFFTTKETGKGTGLGLSTVYGIIKQHRGNISVSSQPGKGTTFKIYFPVTVGTGARREKKSEDGIELKGNETILLVEDNVQVRSLALDVLRMYGYQVLIAGNGREALRILENYRKPVHLLLTDMVMPDIDGIRLFRKISTLRTGIQVIYMSGYTRNMFKNPGEIPEEIEFIQKPFTAQILAGRVRRVLDRAGSSPVTRHQGKGIRDSS